MTEQRKYAILDTDFVSKANIIKTENRMLADEVLAFPGYSFFCHHKMKEELGDHGSCFAYLLKSNWSPKKLRRDKGICSGTDY